MFNSSLFKFLSILKNNFKGFYLMNISNKLSPYKLFMAMTMAIIAGSCQLNAMELSQQVQDPSIPSSDGDCYFVSHGDQSNSVLSSELLEHIFLSNLNLRDLLQCNQVCKTFNDNTQYAVGHAAYEVVTTEHLTALTRLVMNGSHSVQATHVAQRIIQGDERYNPSDQWRAVQTIKHNRWRALQLFKELFNCGHTPAFEIASQVIKQAMQRNDSFVQYNALELCAELVQHKYTQFFDIAIHVAQQGMQSNNGDVKKEALWVFKKLLEYEYTPAFDPAMRAAQEGIQIDHNIGPRIAETIFKLLFQYRYEPSFDAARQAAQQGMQGNGRICAWCASGDILKALKAQGK